MIAFKTLHILNKPPEHARFTLCVSTMGPEDGLLLIENAVLAMAVSAAEMPIGTTKRCFALQPDLEARGLLSTTGADQVVSFDDMVSLVASAQNVVSW